MSEKNTRRRYSKVFNPAFAVYMPSALCAVYFGQRADFPPMVLYAMVAVSVGALLIMIGARWRLINELDEFLRLIEVRSLMVGLSVVLILAASWGLLEMAIEVPRFPLFHILTVFCFVYGPATIFFAKRDGEHELEQ